MHIHVFMGSSTDALYVFSMTFVIIYYRGIFIRYYLLEGYFYSYLSIYQLNMICDENKLHTIMSHDLVSILVTTLNRFKTTATSQFHRLVRRW